MNIEKKDKLKLINDIKYLNNYDHYHIMDIITKNNIKYSENKNGCFIKFTEINDEILNTIIKYVNDNIKKNEKTLNLPKVINTDDVADGIDKLNLTNYEKSILKKNKLLNK